MPTVTIPKELTKRGELVVIPRKEYEEFLDWQKKIKPVRTFRPTAADKKTLARARKDIAEGNYYSWEKVKHELARLHDWSREEAH